MAWFLRLVAAISTATLSGVAAAYIVGRLITQRAPRLDWSELTVIIHSTIWCLPMVLFMLCIAVFIRIGLAMACINIPVPLNLAHFAATGAVVGGTFVALLIWMMQRIMPITAEHIKHEAAEHVAVSGSPIARFLWDNIWLQFTIPAISGAITLTVLRMLWPRR
jgi:hypothetical protein